MVKYTLSSVGYLGLSSIRGSVVDVRLGMVKYTLSSFGYLGVSSMSG